MSVALESGVGFREAAKAAKRVAHEFGDDAGLVTAAQRGDRAAFGRLYEHYARMVHGILLARVPSAEVDDLVHDVFLAALGRLASLREPAAFGGWLAQIARNRSTDFYRRARATDPLDETVAAQRGESVEAREALRAVMQLPETYRETLVLRLVEGMTGPEIARRTGLTPGSVRVTLHRGMKQLREILGKGETHVR